jgi:tRNA pseudouridine38-40 synthase
MRYKVTLSYKGTNYFGWQKQPNVISVQEVIEKVLSTLYNEEISIYASGRTDAGVHANGQVFHFDAAKRYTLSDLKYRLNKMLPSDIYIKKIEHVDDSFHARYSAKSKTYLYKLYLGSKDPFLDDFVLFYPYTFNLDLVRIGINLFKGTHNFQNFTSKEEDEGNFVRTIYDVEVKKRGKRVTFILTGNGFMRGEVRMMIGALLALNEGKIDEKELEMYLNTSKRQVISYKVASKGLYLHNVTY